MHNHCLHSSCTHRYNLSFTTRDDTAEAQFFGYDDVSRRIIKRNIEFMLRQSRQSAGLPQHLRDLVSKKYTFIVTITTSTFASTNNRTYLVKAVSVDFHEQAFIANQMLLLEPSVQTPPLPSSTSTPPQLGSGAGPSNVAQVITDIKTPAGDSVCILPLKRWKIGILVTRDILY